MDLNKIEVLDILNAYKRKGYDMVFPKSPKSDFYQLNIFGIRSTDNTSGKYSDVIGIIRKTSVLPVTQEITTPYHVRKCDQGYVVELFVGTTKPGIPNLLKPVNPKGAAIVVPGFYPNVWIRGLHKGKYPALVQSGHFKVYRDNNKDSIADYAGPIFDSSGDGINLHHGSITPSIFIGLYSAGCQVVKDTDKFKSVFMWNIEKANEEMQRYFNYALFEEKDVL